MDNRLNKGDWVIVNEGSCGQVSYIHNPTLIDVMLNGETVIRIRTDHNEIKKITKEVADIMQGV